MRYVDLVAAAFLVLSGLYLLYYFAVVDVGGDTSSITDSVTRLQNRVSDDAGGSLGARRRRPRRRRRRRPRARDQTATPDVRRRTAGRSGRERGAVPLRPAATVMLVRDADGGGVEVFMVRRTSAPAFAGRSVRVPRRPRRRRRRRSGVAAFVAGLDDREASATLGIATGGLAYWVAAIRECFEEAGLLLACVSGDGTVPETSAAERAAVHDGELSMIELCRRHDVLLDAGALRYVSHWVTPVGETCTTLRHPVLPRRRPRRSGRPS